MKLFNFFKSAKEEIVYDDFSLAKMNLNKTLFEYFQKELGSYIADYTNPYLPNAENPRFMHSFSNPASQVGLIPWIEKQLMKDIKSAKGDLRKERKFDFYKYQKPCFDYLNSNVLPWYISFADKEAPGWNDKNHKVQIAEEKSYLLDLAEIETEEASKRHGMIFDMLSAFYRLATLKPGKLDANDLNTIAMDLVEYGEIKMLNKIFVSGYDTMNKNNLNEILSL